MTTPSRERLRETLLAPWRAGGSATLRDLRQLAWGVGLLLLVTLGLGALAWEFFGSWALGVTVGLFVYVALVYALIVAASLVAVVVYDVVRLLRRRRHGGAGRDSDATGTDG